MPENTGKTLLKMNNFIKLNGKFSISKEVLEFAMNSDEWYHTNGFDITIVPDALLDQDPSVKALLAKFQPHAKLRAIVIKMNAMTFYSMHVDEARAAALNVLLKGQDSVSFFGDPTEDPETFNIETVNYEEDRMFLFNTQRLHGVLNLNEDRYIFSLGFNFPLDYDTIKEFCLENNL